MGFSLTEFMKFLARLQALLNNNNGQSPIPTPIPTGAPIPALTPLPTISPTLLLAEPDPPTPYDTNNGGSANIFELIENLKKAEWTRINAGGPAITDSTGRQWQADTHFASGRSFTCTKATVDPLYCTQRSFRQEDVPPRYNIPVQNGLYTVRLHFSETYYNVAFTRRFSVWLEGSLLVDGLDILTRVQQNQPLILERTATVEDGELTIEFARLWGNPVISGIELLLRSTAEPDEETSAPVRAPTTVPTNAPVAPPTKTPIAPPTKAPVAPPTPRPTFILATSAPMEPPTETPIAPPTKAPIAPPTPRPTFILATPAPMEPPTKAPVLATPAPTVSPTTEAPIAPEPTFDFQDILINCGGDAHEEASGNRVWLADKYFVGGSTYADGLNAIADTEDDYLFHTERYGACSYEIPVPVGEFEIVLHFAEIYFKKPRGRIFDVNVEGTELQNIDLVDLGGGNAYKAISLEVATLVDDGFVSIELTDVVPKVDQPKISAIEIKKLKNHFAHAVPESNGPYSAVDIDNSGSAKVAVDGSASHTHGIGLSLTSWEWKEGSVVVGRGLEPVLDLAVGDHSIFLTVTDSDNNSDTVGTTVSVLPFGFPAVTTLSPSGGSIGGSQQITITGSGFAQSPENTVVYFGDIKLSGDSIRVVDDTTIALLSPKVTLGAPVSVWVETHIGKSNSALFTYVAASEIKFKSEKLYGIDSPTVAAFSPIGDLYVGNMKGQLARLTFNDDFNKVESKVISMISMYRPITGIAFDPMDTSGIPAVYVASNFFFHGESESTSGNAINGKIHKVSGANLDLKEDIITGLPVSDHDHGINALEFGDNGELYLNLGGSTNGGIKGQLSGSQQLEESYYSAATLVADLSDPAFDGVVKYNKPDGGKPVSGSVKVFATGLRNSYGIALHSNGLLYGTDNGPNKGYGDMMTSCDGGFIPDVYTNDRLNVIESGLYYGHPNPVRAKIDNDSRQCTYRRPNEPSGNGYSAPVLILPSSSDGLIEYRANYFDGQLQNDLIISKYSGPLYRVILGQDGRSSKTSHAIELVGDGGLDVAQAPNGHLVEVRLDSNSLWLHTADEAPKQSLFVHSVFPYRGGEAGGNILSIYGQLLNDATISVGGKNCPIQSTSASKITCVLPGGSGAVDVVVSGPRGTYNYSSSYRYIAGKKR